MLFQHGGFSPSFISLTLLTGTVLYFNENCKLYFGICAEVIEDTHPLNGNNNRTDMDTCPGTKDNLQLGILSSI